MFDDFEKEIRDIFFQEASINLEQAEEAYLKMDEDSTVELIELCFRIAHNLKGSAKREHYEFIPLFFWLRIFSLLIL